MIRITQLKLHPGEDERCLEEAIRRTLHLKEGEAFSYEVLRRSIDARKKPDLYEIFTVHVSLLDAKTEKRILRQRLKQVEEVHPVRYLYASKKDSGHDAEALPPRRTKGFDPVTDPDRPLIVGTGPAGLFCGLLLAREGRRPVLIERGKRAKERTQLVRRFWEGGPLDPETNVQFGEGGAGTFSDGKLNTGVKDPEGRIRFILRTFAEAGADPRILYDAKPHVGTDVLRDVVTNLTDEICERGGEVHFETRMEKLERSESGLWQISCTGPGMTRVSFCARHVVLAIGHSARDTFRMLDGSGVLMVPKSFAVGIRIQHPQSMIDTAMYGEDCRYDLPASSYKLTHRLGGGRGVYSFCMCPGGYVVNASSEEGHLCVNGMSFHDRASMAANSAIVVTLSPEEILEEEGLSSQDAGKADPLIGVRFQKRLERSAHLAAKGAIPVQRFEDFCRNRPDTDAGHLSFAPRFSGSWRMADVRQILPERIASGIEEGVLAWERQIKGFASPDALVCAVESRTSSPVRILRNQSLQANGLDGLYPCGEGAGYAGGITSAAADGLKTAEQILRSSGAGERHGWPGV